MKTLYELKQNLVTVGQQLKKVEEQLAEKAIDPNASMEDIQALQGSKSDLKMRFDVIKEQHDALEAEQKAKLKANFEAKDNINSVD
ncbi:phage major capsid protein, partial [Paenibacillus larvae]